MSDNFVCLGSRRIMRRDVCIIVAGALVANVCPLALATWRRGRKVRHARFTRLGDGYVVVDGWVLTLRDIAS